MSYHRSAFNILIVQFQSYRQRVLIYPGLYSVLAWFSVVRTHIGSGARTFSTNLFVVAFHRLTMTGHDIYLNCGSGSLVLM